MSFRQHCARCEVEWHTDDAEACWLCGGPGARGPLPSMPSRLSAPGDGQTAWETTARAAS